MPYFGRIILLGAVAHVALAALTGLSVFLLV
jgi:hypothetical protein